MTWVENGNGQCYIKLLYSILVLCVSFTPTYPQSLCLRVFYTIAIKIYMGPCPISVYTITLHFNSPIEDTIFRTTHVIKFRDNAHQE